MFAIAGIAGLCGLVGVIWTVVIAFQNGDTIWGIVSIFCGIAAIIYAVQHLDQCKVPLTLMIISIVGNIGYGVVAQ